MRSVLKLTWRSIRTFMGRYLALLLIVALSAGFFAGLKLTTASMRNTGNRFVSSQNMYDFRLFSTLGFTDEDVEAFSALSAIEVAEGTNSVDALIDHADNHSPFKLYALSEKTNLPYLIAGRMPTVKNECLADFQRFDETDIGKVLMLSEENDESLYEELDGKVYTIVGIVSSPMHLGIDRGTTGIGSGAISAYLYLPKENFKGAYYTEIDLVLTEKADIYTNRYETLIDQNRESVTLLANDLAARRYETLLDGMGLTPTLAEQLGLNAPEVYVLTRFENAGYMSFENDTAILSGVANIFPIFFVLVALLVCVTTMTRMVDEERTQIGVLKAMGYSNAKIMAKYLLYAGSATAIGWAIGFVLCTWGLPEIFWMVYAALYGFAPLTYYFSPVMAILTLSVSLLMILGATFISCRKELMSVPANLIRPRAAKNGKRIFLERIGTFWHKLSFLQKIVLRNLFRYKRRLIMMLIGISCCAGLILTAFGVRDSMIDIGSIQYEEIQQYEIEASFEKGREDAVTQKLADIADIDDHVMVALHRVDLVGKSIMSSVNLLSASDTDKLSEFWDFHRGENDLPFPQKGEVMINQKIADNLGLSVGDSFDLQNAELRSFSVTVSGIFDNYIYNYAVISEETYREAFGEWQANTALIKTSADSEEVAGRLTDLDEITSVSQLEKTKEAVDSALSALDYIIWLVVLFSGALTFIVIFNLTNINIAERSREIATVQVLGFYPKETNSYVLRENLILSVLASLIGLPVGVLFHRIVMSMIVIDSFTFHLTVAPISYLLSVLCTVVFAVIVNLFMRRQIVKIKMAESLKAVE